MHTLSKPIRILFIGNSYTYVNRLPVMLKRLAKVEGKHVVCLQIARAAAKLSDFLNPEDRLGKRFLEALHHKQWDYVVIQEQSQLPATLEGRELMFQSVRRLTDLVRHHQAEPVLYMTWGRKNRDPETGHESFASMQKVIEESYKMIAEETHTILAPVGLAWQTAVEQLHYEQLWVSDESHPTPAGTYLAACVLYQVLLGQDGLQLSAKGQWGVTEETAQLLAKASRITMKQEGKNENC